jgi:putative ABC transport system substrate-binding protein
MLGIRRREFITLLGGATATWPLAARAQQAAMPVIGFLSSGAHQQLDEVLRLAPFREGLKETGYVEGVNVTAEFRWAEDHYDRLPELATDLVRRRPAVIATLGGPTAALAAKRASMTVPIVFAVAGDPVGLGLVLSLNRPGGNVTGVATLTDVVVPKQFEVLHETVPTATVIGCLLTGSGCLNERFSGSERSTSKRTVRLREARSPRGPMLLPVKR